MKLKSKYYLSIACSVLSLCVSCDDYLDIHPDNILTLDAVFNNENRMKEWYANVYSYTWDPNWTWARHGGFDILADDAQVPAAWAQFGWWSVAAQTGSWSPRSVGEDRWNSHYKAVRAAYIFLNQAKPVGSLDQATIDKMKLDIRFLIAYYNSFMFELYGSFPLIEAEVAVDVPAEELTVPRTPIDAILTKLDSELEYLSNNLPEEVVPIDFGKPTKMAAKACRARLWLIAASPLYNGSAVTAKLKNKDGQALFPISPDPSKWEKAREVTKLVVEDNNYALFEQYTKTGQVDPFLSFQNLFLTFTDNKEILYGTTGSPQYTLYAGHSLPKGSSFGGNNGYAVTQQLVDAFYTKNGLPITEDPSYVGSGESSRNVTYDTEWNLNTAKIAGLVTSRGAFNMYVNREPRFYISVLYNNQYLPAANRTTQFFSGGIDGNSDWNHPPTGYLNRKKVSPSDNPQSGTYPIRPMIIYRLGEFYLNYAEILNEISYNSNKIEILRYLNKIRERAGIPVYGDNPGEIPVPANYEDMKKAIRNERRVELALEGKRYMDIRRWMIADKVYDTPITGMNINGNNKTFYDNPGKNPVMQRTWDDKMYFWPIPQESIDRNENLVQNLGWSGDVENLIVNQ